MKILKNTLFFAFLGLLGSQLTLSMERPPSRGNTVILQVDETSLHRAITDRDINLTNYLLVGRMAPINGQDEAGNTALHILKSQMALLPLTTKNAQDLAKEKAKLAQIQLILQREGINSQIQNRGSITAQEWYNYLANDIEQDKIVSKFAPMHIFKENLLFNNVPEQFIADFADPNDDVDNSDHNFVTIKQMRGDRKMYLRLEKLSQSPTWFTNKPLTLTSITQDKMRDDKDHLHNFSRIADQFIDWGKKITDEDLNIFWIPLLLQNVKFELREHQRDSYLFIVKCAYCLTNIDDPAPCETLFKTKGLIPGALIYLFNKNTNLCYHRYLHTATSQEKFDQSFNKLKNTKLH